MRVIDRIFEYLRHHHLTTYTFERACGIANGYLKKQMKGKGTVGSEILEKIIDQYKDLSLTWLLTGKGEMIVASNYNKEIESGNLSEEQPAYPSQEQIIKLLREKINILQNSIADKEKIIGLLEKRDSKD